MSPKRKFDCFDFNLTTDNAFETVRKRYKQEINFKYEVSHVIFVYCLSAELDPSFVSALLTSYDRDVHINNHWAPPNTSSSLKVWYGALAKYTCEKFAKAAADNIQKKFRFLKVMFFKEIMDILLLAELHCPKPFEEGTMIVFKGPRTFNDKDIPGVKKILKLFGIPSDAQYYLQEYPDSVILEVAYPSQFQAYAAKIAMDGLGLRKVGYVSVEIVVSENGKQFDKFVRRQFRCIAHND